MRKIFEKIEEYHTNKRRSSPKPFSVSNCAPSINAEEDYNDGHGEKMRGLGDYGIIFMRRND